MTSPTEATATRPYARGLSYFKRAVDERMSASLIPPPKLTLSQWAERYGFLSPETSAETGRFRAFGYQRGMMDAITDPTVERITVLKAARVGYTKVLDHVVGYFIHQDPSPMLVVQPRVEDAEDYSKTEIAPMLRDTPALAEIVGTVKGKDPNFTIRKKTFRNGASLSLLGANSPNEFRRVTARIVAFDEVDAYPVDTAEGDQISLGERRTTSFWNRKLILGSTPTVKGESRIETAWEESDQRRYYVPCPHCNERQLLEFGARSAHGLKWPKDEAGKHLPDQAHYVCVNGCVIDESHKPWMIDNGEWVATRPSAGHAGFHISALYSLFYNARWAVIAREFLEVKDDPPRYQVFVNTVLGETWEIPADQEIDQAALMARREPYAADVPDGVGLLTFAADTQDDRLEAEVIGWGFDEESWSIEHFVLMGDPEGREVWDELDAIRNRAWQRADGRTLYVQAGCVDTAGHHTEAAYKYCTPRVPRRVWPIRGQSFKGGQRAPVFPRKPGRSKSKGAHPVYGINVDAAKDVIFPRFGIERPGPGYCHFPAHYEPGYFHQLTAEKPVSEKVNGRWIRRWKLKPGRRNEAFDLRVYNYAALCGLQQAGLKLNKVCAEMAATRPEERSEMPAAEAQQPARMPEPMEQPKTSPGTHAGRRQRRRGRVRARMVVG